MEKKLLILEKIIFNQRIICSLCNKVFFFGTKTFFFCCFKMSFSLKLTKTTFFRWLFRHGLLALATQNNIFFYRFCQFLQRTDFQAKSFGMIAALFSSVLVYCISTSYSCTNSMGEEVGQSMVSMELSVIAYMNAGMVLLKN